MFGTSTLAPYLRTSTVAPAPSHQHRRTGTFALVHPAPPGLHFELCPRLDAFQPQSERELGDDGEADEAGKRDAHGDRR